MNSSAAPPTLWRKTSLALAQAWVSLAREDGLALHAARVASRRLREVLPVLAARRHRGKLRKARRTVRKITRTLGPVRELDVALAMLRDIESGRPELRPAIEVVRSEVNGERTRWRLKMLERVSDVDISKLDQQLSALAEPDGATGRRGGTPVWRAVLAIRIENRARTLGGAVRDAGAVYLPDRLHRVRVAVKKLRYALELARDARALHAAGMVRILKKVQDTLGRLHDLEVLIARTRAVEADLKRPSRRTIEDLNTAIRLMEQEARELHARYVGFRKDIIAICDASVRELPRALRRAQGVARPPSDALPRVRSRPARLLEAVLRKVKPRRAITAADRARGR